MEKNFHPIFSEFRLRVFKWPTSNIWKYLKLSYLPSLKGKKEAKKMNMFGKNIFISGHMVSTKREKDKHFIVCLISFSVSFYSIKSLPLHIGIQAKKNW